MLIRTQARKASILSNSSYQTGRNSDHSQQAPLVAHGLFSYQIGGSERVGADLAIEFKRRGYEVVCFALYDTDGPIRSELEANGIRCLDLNYETRRPPWRRITYQLEFFRFLKSQRIDSLVVHHATALVLCGIPAWFAKVRRVVMIEHAIHQLRERPRYLRSAMRYCRFADVITGVDQQIVDFFRDEMKVPAAKLRYVPNGVRLQAPNAEIRAQTRTTLGLSPSDFIFLFVGRLQPVKDVPTLLAAVAAMPPQLRHEMKVLLAGDGPERTRLQEQAKALDIDGTVRFLGARSDVDKLLHAADAFVMTSVTEGQPMALIEAMAARVPCVATSVGGIPALLRDGAGLLAKPSQPNEIAEAMTAMMASSELRSSCAVTAQARIESQHSLDRVVDTYLSELELPNCFT